MAHEILVTVEGSHLVGKLPADAEAIMDLEGGTYRCVLTEPSNRSLSQLKLWWAICGMIADNFDGYILTAENVSDILKIETGHCSIWRDAKGGYRRSPRSIALNKMTSADFSQLMDRAIAKAGELFGPGLAEAARTELDKIAAPDLTKAAA